MLITKFGGTTAYQIVCHKNRDDFDRLKFIGKTVLGESDGFKKTKELVLN